MITRPRPGLRHFVLAAALAGGAAGASAQIDLGQYTRIGVYNLPAAPTAVNKLAHEASGVTYNWDRDTLFVVGDGGTSIVEVSKTGQLIGSMALSGFTTTSVGDPEGIAYIGNGQVVLSLERIRQAALVNYAAGGTATLASTPRVATGPATGNVGNEGIAWDGGSNFVFAKQEQPQQLFASSISFATLSSSNGNASTQPTGLFDPAVFGAPTLSDVYALSVLPGTLTGSDAGNLLVLSATANKVWEVSRSGVILSSLTLEGSSATINEGLAMDRNGLLYVVNEEGGGTLDLPQLWVYAPVPEPSTWLMLGAGLAVMTLRRKRS